MKQNLLFNRANAFGMRFIMVLTMLLIVGIGQAWGAEETATNNCKSAVPGAASDLENGKLIQWKVSSTNTYSNPIRVYANTTITISAKTGVKRITKVEITASSTGNYVTYTANATWTATGTGTCSVGTKSTSGTLITVPMNGDVTTVTIKPSSQTRWSKVVVTYETAAATTYTVTYDLNGGTGTTPTQANVAAGGTFTLAASSEFSKTGYSFAGWNDGTTTYDAGSTYTMPAMDVTLTAQWTPLAQHTVTWKVNGIEYTVGDPTTQVYDGSKVTKLPTAPNPVNNCGEVFAGWTTTPIDGTTNTKPSVLFTTAANSPTITGETTFHAVFANYVNE